MIKLLGFLLFIFSCLALSNTEVGVVPTYGDNICEHEFGADVVSINEISSVTINENSLAVFKVSSFSLFSLDKTEEELLFELNRGESLQLKYNDDNSEIKIKYTYCGESEKEIFIRQELLINRTDESTNKSFYVNYKLTR